MTTKRLAVLGIGALVACSNSSTPLDLSALDLSGRWTLLDSATARQEDTDVVYATVVARGTVVLAALGAGTYTMSEGFALHFTLIDSTARLTNEISREESRVDPAATDPNAMGCGRAVSLFTRLGSAPHPSSCIETLLLVKQ